MLNKVAWPATGQVFPVEEPLIDVVDAFRVLKRQRRLFTIVLTLAIALAVVYLLMTPPGYTASALLLFDAHQSDGLQQPTIPSPATDSAYVDSQIEVLKSDAIARAVITKLNLDSDPEFLAPANPVLAAIGATARFLRDLVKSPENDPANVDPLGPFIAFFQSNLVAKRIGMTYVADVSYRSRDRAKAAKISNAIVEAYIFSQLDSKYRAAGQAATWLQERVKELESKAQSAEKAVAEYKAHNNIADSARPLSEAELATISGQRRAALADLESKAQTYRSLHESFVQRAGQQMLPTTEARLVSAAVPPVDKSDPKTLLVLAAACLVGAFGGLAASFAREHLNAAFVSPAQIEKELGTRCLGIFPALPKKTPRQSRAADSGRLGAGSKRQDGARRIISRDPYRHTRAIDEPFSLWSEAIRFLAADVMGHSESGSVIGVGSALAGEGKSMAAANLAQLIADAGRKVLLVDCDLRNPGLTRSLAPEATQGLLDSLASAKEPLDHFAWHDPATGLHFLPAPTPLIQTMHPTRTLSSEKMQSLLAGARETYDYVVLDLPPISPVADVKAVSHLVDSFVLVIEWGRTPQAVVLASLSSAPAVAGKLLGAVLNKASPSALKYAESYRARPRG
jgi:capsular exopolysaccharide synthesis family protein